MIVNTPLENVRVASTHRAPIKLLHNLRTATRNATAVDFSTHENIHDGISQQDVIARRHTDASCAVWQHIARCWQVGDHDGAATSQCLDTDQTQTFLIT